MIFWKFLKTENYSVFFYPYLLLSKQNIITHFSILLLSFEKYGALHTCLSHVSIGHDFFPKEESSTTWDTRRIVPSIFGRGDDGGGIDDGFVSSGVFLIKVKGCMPIIYFAERSGVFLNFSQKKKGINSYCSWKCISVDYGLIVDITVYTYTRLKSYFGMWIPSSVHI